VEESEYLPGKRQSFHDEAFDMRLTSSGRLPDLGGAPLASWLMARLAKLTDDGFPSSGTEHNDGGGWCIEFVVYVADERPIATFQFQGDMHGAAVFGERTQDCDPEAVLSAMATALLEHPEDLLPCRLRVVDPEWEEDPACYEPMPAPGDRNVYGWNGERFLGKKNIREKHIQPSPPPDSESENE
jgi:hypothetical protein